MHNIQQRPQAATAGRPAARLAIVIALLGGLSACGGSGSDSSDASTPANGAPASRTLGGTAAIGAPIAQGTVDVRCASGSLQATTGADGVWQVTLDASQGFPCAVQVSGGSPAITLHSYATAPGTVNITPLTDLVLAHATTQAPSAWFGHWTPISETALDTSRKAVASALIAAGYALPEGSVFTSPFQIGDAWDQALDRLGEAVSTSSLNGHGGLLDQVASGNLAAIPKAAPAAGSGGGGMDPAQQELLNRIKAMAGTHYVGHQGSSRACFGWGWPAPHPSKPHAQTYYQLRIDGQTGSATLRPVNTAVFLDAMAGAPDSITVSPADAGSELQSVLLAKDVPGVAIWSRTRSVGISLAAGADGQLRQDAIAYAATDMSSGYCEFRGYLVSNPALPPADAEIPSSLRTGSASATFSHAPFGGPADGDKVPGSPYDAGQSVSIAIGATTLTVDGKVLQGPRRPPNDTEPVPTAFIFQDDERWYWLYNNPAQPRIHVYGGASPASPATVFHGALSFSLAP